MDNEEFKRLLYSSDKQIHPFTSNDNIYQV